MMVNTGEWSRAKSARDRRSPIHYMYERNFEFKFYKKKYKKCINTIIYIYIIRNNVNWNMC